ncbi:DMT family transporter [Microbacterium sp. NIBRBAC000506063]|uniref:DMT family transporter n=1 Tax=Microbacterium sp. NIBRBAC000506063 TaxID=2734618 RepID=UPI001BB4FE22|nr:multidrug efflux SMR transporter [Microbacterium sp. NIBRBAC000506063]QTV79985.1 multidrug efflux SMR transporter [Microbacterium sp. NIBRBAC000506063]
MSWIILIASGVFEAVWATALGKSDGLTKLWPSIVFFGALAVSMFGLAWAMKDIPTGTAYAVWVGVGASLTVIWAMITGDTDISWVRILLLMGLIGCIVGLKLVDGDAH